MGLEDILSSALGGGAMGQIASRLGTDEGSAQKAVSAALPALLGRLKDNAENPEQGQALANALKDHDGGVLDNLGGLFGGTDSGLAAVGPKILGHVFGGDTSNVNNLVAKESGLDMGKAAGLLGMLAPLVMGALGKAGGASAGPAGISNMLGGLLGGGSGGSNPLGAILGGLMGGGGGGLGALGQMMGGASNAASGAASGAAGSAGGMMGKVTGMLDQNKDGSIVDDVTRMATGKGGGKAGMLGKLMGMLKKR